MSNYEQVYSSTLSAKRVIISLLLFFSIPLLSYGANFILNNQTVATTLVINVIGCILVIYNWNLIGIHYNRSKNDLKTFFLFLIVGIIGVTLWTFINNTFLKGTILTPDKATLDMYPAGCVCILAAYACVLPLLMSMASKCMTDFMPIKKKEVQVIMVTGFLFALTYVVVFIPFNFMLWVQSYLYYVVLFMFLSYLYNQSSSFMPGTLAYSIVLLITFILNWLL